MKRLLSLALSSLVLFVSLPLQGCISQTQTAALINELGSLGVAIATAENHPTLAAKLQTDIAAASNAVLNWKKGDATDTAIELLNVVSDDLNLIPGTSKYAPLIQFALGTVTSIIETFAPVAPASVTAALSNRVAVHIPHAPKTAAEFEKQAKAIAAQNHLALAY